MLAQVRLDGREQHVEMTHRLFVHTQASTAASNGSRSSAQASGGAGAASVTSPTRDSNSSPEPATEAQRLARVPPKLDTRAEIARVPPTAPF